MRLLSHERNVHTDASGDIWGARNTLVCSIIGSSDSEHVRPVTEGKMVFRIHWWQLIVLIIILFYCRLSESSAGMFMMISDVHDDAYE